MIGLHLADCACEDCRSRRLIRSADRAAEGYQADEREDFGFVLKRKEEGGDDD